MAVMKASMKTMKAMKVSKGSMKKLGSGQKTWAAIRELKNEVTKLREGNAALRAELHRERGSRLDILLQMVALQRERQLERDYCQSLERERQLEREQLE